MNKIKLLLYSIDVEAAPNWAMKHAFEKKFDCIHYNWIDNALKYGNGNLSNGLNKVFSDILEIIKTQKPEYAFMQIQNPANMPVSVMSEIAKYTKVINWTGDVRNNEEWYKWFENIGRVIFLTLFSNEADPKIMEKRGIRADYLQIGFDNICYNIRLPKPNYPEIVFCANYYDNFQCGEYRVNVIKALMQHFPTKFKLFGSGWSKFNINTYSVKNDEEANLYNSCKIAISVSNYAIDRYYSDRLLRIMGCGALPLSHDFPLLHKDFTPDYNIVVFKNINELIEKCNYYLQNEIKRKNIANNAYKYAHNNCTWDIRCNELIELIKKYENNI